MKVLVYGTLKKGFYNHILLEKSKFIDSGYFFIENTSLKANKDFSFPYLFLNKQGEDNFFYGELYEINEETLKSLDQLEGHPDFYQRIYVKEIDAFVYISRDETLKEVDTINNFNNDLIVDVDLIQLKDIASRNKNFKFKIDSRNIILESKK